MSHFTVMVKITPEQLHEKVKQLEQLDSSIMQAAFEQLEEYFSKAAQNDFSSIVPKPVLDRAVESIVSEMLEPYNEQSADYREFKDTEDENFEEYNNKIFESNGYLEEKHPEKIGKKPCEIWDTFEEYMSDWCGEKRDEFHNRYGYWHNPNGHWDWFQIGGRWRGKLPVHTTAEVQGLGEKSWTNKEEPDVDGSVDYAYLKDIDFNLLNVRQQENINSFWLSWERYQNLEQIIKEDADKETRIEYARLNWDIHDTLCSLGLRRCVKDREPVFDENGQPVMECDSFETTMASSLNRQPRKFQKYTEPVFETDSFTLEDLRTKYAWYWEFSTFAVVDRFGWQAKGKMGWFGISSASDDENQQWKRSFYESHLKDESPDSLVVIVDCHV